jgi:dipeptide transport system ATP-binding protein
MTGEVILSANALARQYAISRGAFASPLALKAVDGASFTLAARETLAVVGESGCGKSTLARMVAMIEPPSSGSLVIDGIDVVTASRGELKRLRSEVQIVFQDPYGSLNPRQKIGSILEEPLKLNRRAMSGAERRAAAVDMMAQVGLRPEHYERYPHMFSGGQRQRIAIARALMLQPRILVLDEPVSALDLSVQAQVLNILSDLKEGFGLAYLFISHGLSVVRHMADDVMVMYLGRPVEYGSRDAIFENPRHPYTRALLSATPVADPSRPKERIKLAGEVPSPINPPSGCAFHPRCPLAFDRCRMERPELERKGDIRVACFAVDDAGRVVRAVRTLPPGPMDVEPADVRIETGPVSLYPGEDSGGTPQA